jgi:hypothetical protein
MPSFIDGRRSLQQDQQFEDRSGLFQAPPSASVREAESPGSRLSLTI